MRDTIASVVRRIAAEVEDFSRSCPEGPSGGDNSPYRFAMHVTRGTGRDPADGSGYPRRLRRLPDATELFAAVDFFEAVTHHRPQRGPVTPHEGMRMLKDMGRGVFRRQVVKSLLDAFSLYPVFSVVKLSGGEVGQVVRVHAHWPLQPVVRLLFDRRGGKVAPRREIDLLRDSRFITRDISDRVFLDNYFRIE